MNEGAIFLREHRAKERARLFNAAFFIFVLTGAACTLFLATIVITREYTLAEVRAEQKRLDKPKQAWSCTEALRICQSAMQDRFRSK